ncbi:MAG TPA: hypothetical protein VKZ18_04515 [Polyangia bacterium]|nr:hypothetical protein [Polyangia bacterium]
MNKTSLRLLALSLPAVLAWACGSGNGLMTKGEFCSRLATPTCNREIACGNLASTQLSYCLTSFQSGCCTDDNSCGQQLMNSTQETEAESVISSCSAALSTASCSDLAAGNVPVACGGTSTAYYAAPAVAAPHQAGAAARALLH